MFEVRLSRRAARYYSRVSAEIARRLDRCFDFLSKNPYVSESIRPIRGLKGVYRYRVGDLRVIYEVNPKENVVRILTILPRGNAYK